MDPKNNYLPDYLTIPCVLIRDKRLQPFDYLVYGIIYWYSRMKLERCVATNATIAGLLHSTSSSIANSISRLSKAGFVHVVLDPNVKGKNKVRQELIPLIVFTTESSLNSDTPLHQIVKPPSLNSDTPPSPDSEENNNILEKEYIKSTPPVDKHNVKKEESVTSPHSKDYEPLVPAKAKKSYSESAYLLNLDKDDVLWFQQRFTSLDEATIRKEAENAYYWYKSKGIHRKDYQASLRNWLAKKDTFAPSKRGGVTYEE